MEHFFSQEADDLDNMFTDDLVNQITQNMDLGFDVNEKALFEQLGQCKTEKDEKILFGSRMIEDEEMLKNAIFGSAKVEERSLSYQQVAELFSSCSIANLLLSQDVGEVKDLLRATRSEEELEAGAPYNNQKILEAARLAIGFRVQQLQSE